MTATPLPLYTAIPDVPADLAAAINNLEKFSIPRYASAAARDAAIPSPVDGMVCYVAGLGFLKNVGGTVAGWAPLYTLPYVPVTAAGTATISVPNAGQFVNTTVALPGGRFSAAPSILLSSNSGNGSAVRATLAADTISATSFRLRLELNAAASGAFTFPVAWYATEINY
jgi:hypothetical protein